MRKILTTLALGVLLVLPYTVESYSKDHALYQAGFVSGFWEGAHVTCSTPMTGGVLQAQLRSEITSTPNTSQDVREILASLLQRDGCKPM